MGYTKFFSDKKFRGSQQTHIKNIIVGTPKQQTSSQGWIKQEKRGKISPNGGMAKWVLWRANQRLKPLGLKITLEGVTTSNLSKNRHCLFGLPSCKMIKTLTPFFLLLKTLFPCFFFSFWLLHLSTLLHTFFIFLFISNHGLSPLA